MRWICLLGILLLSGCQQPLTRSGGSAVPDTPDDGLQRLIDFSSRFEAHTRKDQLALCQEMRESLAHEGDAWTGWYLATAISEVDGCGDEEEAIALIRHLLEQRFVSREMGWLAYYQIQLLQRQQQQRRQLRKAAAEQRKLQERFDLMEQAKRLLEDQLRDLKRIETSINQRLDEKQQGNIPPVPKPADPAGR